MAGCLACCNGVKTAHRSSLLTAWLGSDSENIKEGGWHRGISFILALNNTLYHTAT